MLTVDPALGDIAGGDVLIEGDTIAQVGNGPVRRRGGDRRDRQHRDPGVHRQPPAHVGGGDPQLRAERHPRRLLRRGARQLRPALPPGGRLREQPRRRAGVHQRRHHDAGRLVAHQQHARSSGRRRSRACRSPASGRSTRTAARTRSLADYWFNELDRDPARRRRADQEHVLLLRRRPADDGPGHPRSGLLPGRRGAQRVGHGPRPRHPDHRARRDGPAGRQVVGMVKQLERPRACSAPTPRTSTAATSATRSGSWSRRQQGHDLHRAAGGDADGPRLAAGDEGRSLRPAAEPVDRRRHHRARRHVHRDAVRRSAERAGESTTRSGRARSPCPRTR